MAGGFGNPPGASDKRPVRPVTLGSARDARFGLTNPNHRERRKMAGGFGNPPGASDKRSVRPVTLGSD